MKKFSKVHSAGLLSAVFFSVFSLSALALTPQNPAPEFAEKNQDGKVIRLSELKGKPVLIYFYPKDDTPGCTKEACAFRDEHEKFKSLGAVVLGVSRQDEKSHRAFAAKHKLPFDLLADVDGSMAKAYDIGTYPLIGITKRQSVLIGADGNIVRVYSSVEPETHAMQVLKDLQDYAIHSNKRK